MKTIFITAVLLAFSAGLFSQDGLTIPAAENSPDLISLDEFAGKEQKLDINTLRYNIQNPVKKKKSMPLGIVLSALIPGAGEFYGEDYLKAGIFFGVELLAWGTYVLYTVKGDDKTDQYQAYANENWNVRRYARWLKEEFGASVDPQAPEPELWEQINNFERGEFSHTLPPYGTQQYYELIGKYQNFMGGWADAESGGVWLVTKQNYAAPYNYRTAMFIEYSTDRGDANSYYNTAKIGPIVAIVNHILSAADAAWTISAYNKKIELETGFRMDVAPSPFTYKMEYKPTFNMKISF